jgi:subtilisin family serine protease
MAAASRPLLLDRRFGRVTALVTAGAVLALAGAAATASAADYVVALDPGGSAAAAGQVARHEGITPRAVYGGAGAGFAADLSAREAARLAHSPDVAFVQRDYEVRAAGTAVAAAAPKPAAEVVPPGVRRVGAATAAGAGAAVAVLDTGISTTTELNRRAGTNCVSPRIAPTDDNGHGTHVAGIIGARANGAATVGVAPDTPVYAVKVLNNRMSGTLSQLLCGLEWVRTNAAALGIRVVNFSIVAPGADDGACGTVNNDALHRAICALTNAGVLVVAAAGNGSTAMTSTVPAAYGEVLSVTSMADTDGQPGGLGAAPCGGGDVDDRYGYQSNYAPATSTALQAHLIAAPGVCVLSTGVGTPTAAYTGTSQAAPHVAAAAARCIRDAGVAGPCSTLAPRDIARRLITDAVSGGSGFAGDPLRPVSGRAYGPLASVAAY